MRILLKAINISAQYGDQPLFAHVNLTLAARERVGLVGPNGVGKSTLLRILAGVQPPAIGYVSIDPSDRLGYFAQQVPDPDQRVSTFLDDAPGDLAALHRRWRAACRTLAAAGSSPTRTVLHEHADAQDRYAQAGGWAYEARVDEVRDRLGIAGLSASTRLGTLSGGEQARLMLARVLLASPTLLVLDEPTNHLDADGIGWLGGHLSGFTGGVLVVTHDRAFLDRVATRIVELDAIHDEPQFYQGGYTDYRAEKQRRWERLLLDFEAQEKTRERLAADIERTKQQSISVELATRNDHFRRIAKKVAKKAKARERRLNRQMQAAAWIAQPQTRPPLVLPLEAAGLDLLEAAGPAGPAVGAAAPGRPEAGAGGSSAARVLIDATGVCLRYGDRVVASDVSLRVRAGDRLVIGGANGTGKTTLLRCLAGHLDPAAGSVVISGRVELLPQMHDDLRLRLSAIDFFRSRVPMYVDDAEATLSAYLFDEDQRRQPIGTLSAGELRRLVLATMINRRADVLLLDEPTNFFDFDALDVVEEALRAYAGTLIVVTHDAYLAKAIECDQRYEICQQTLIRCR